MLKQILENNIVVHKPTGMVVTEKNGKYNDRLF